MNPPHAYGQCSAPCELQNENNSNMPEALREEPSTFGCRSIMSRFGTGASSGPVPRDSASLPPPSIDDRIVIVRDNVRGCVDFRGCSDSFRGLLQNIKELLAGEPDPLTLRQIDELYGKILECEFSWIEIKELESIKKKISNKFFDYVDIQKKKLIDDLKTCHRQDSDGGADRFFRDFIKNIEILFSDLTTVMQNILYNVGIQIISSEYDDHKINQLKIQLSRVVNRCQAGVISNSRFSGDGTETKLNQCRHTARRIQIQDSKKTPQNPAVLKNYLSQLESILADSLPLTDEDVLQQQRTIKIIESTLASEAEIDLAEEADYRWNRKLFDAILNARFSSKFMNQYGHCIPRKPPEQWLPEDLEAFISVFINTQEFKKNCPVNYQFLLKKMAGVHNDAVSEFPYASSAAAGCSFWDEIAADGARNHYDETMVEKPLTEPEWRREFDNFLHAVSQNISGEYGSEERLKHSGWRYVAELILGKRASVSNGARKSLRFLAGMSKQVVLSANLNFFDVSGMQKAKNSLDSLTSLLNDFKPDQIDIRQNSNQPEVSLTFMKKGAEPVEFLMPAVTESGIPIESMAMDIQLLCGKKEMTRLFSYNGIPLEFRYHRPQITGSSHFR